VHPFRFAVQLSKAPSPAAWRDLARKIEDLGYSTLYIPDHFDEQFGPLVALTVAAEATGRLRVGSLVFDNDYRHPLVLAKETATLDLFSEGRLEVGIGAGWLRSDYDESGFAGEHFQLAGAHGFPRPHSRPHPPLLVGGGSPRVLAIAGREADIVGINPSLAAGRIGPEIGAQLGVDRYRERVAWVRQAAGDRDVELQCLTFFVSVGEPRRVLSERLAMLLGLPPEVAAEVPLALGGTVEEIVETLEQRREDLGLTYWVIHEAELEAFAPVVGRLAGTGGS
jgi:alkanesulfonate monooxygenase SsuD/methylene tetrahydromethanopterin reductase-like flavin-dependent oxidoreductase (luciferase family)